MRKTASAAVVLFSSVVALSACSPPGEEPSTATSYNPPSVWTGSPAPNTGEQQPSTGKVLRAQLNAGDGTPVATATIEFPGDYAVITVETIGDGILKPGFHGLHIHKTGKCEANFTSAGGHFQAPGHDGQHPASGDLSSLQVRETGAARLVTTSDAFTADQLLAGEKTSIIIHEKSDNFANIPPDKYKQINGDAPGPDQATLDTGDAGSRVACGVISG